MNYLQELGASIGIAAASSPVVERDNSHVIFLSIDEKFALLGYSDGYDVYGLGHDAPIRLASKTNTEPVVYMRVLQGRKQTRNIAGVFKTSPSVVRYFDLTTNESFHLTRLTSTVVSILTCRDAICIQTDGRIHVYNPESLEEIFSIQTMTGGGSAVDLHQRWIAYNMLPQQPIVNSSPTSSAILSHVWNKLSSIGQDAFDNMVIAVSNHPGVSTGNAESKSTMSALQSPVKVSRDTRNGMVAIQDVVTQKMLSFIEERNCENRPVECIKWSNCGTRLMVTSGNGHSVLIYGVAVGGSRKNFIDFELIHTLNRGITPAVISDMCMSTKYAAIATTKGTVHLFSLLDGSYVGKITSNGNSVSNCETRVCIDGSTLTMINKKELTLEQYSETLSLKRSDYLIRPLVGSEDVVMTEPISRPAILESRTLDISIKTCNEVDVPLWMSPNFEFRTKATIDHGVRIEYSQPIEKESLRRSIKEALETPLEDVSTPETEKYVMSSREGFINIVPITT
jgi:WD40 repeat protein